MAQNGLSYNSVHVTTICWPTGAALVTGRNHHRVGFGSVCEGSVCEGSVCEFPGPFPDYSTVTPRSCVSLPRILRGNGDNGHATGGFGK